MPKHPGRPKGSDTVPAWLTPGEFVMNAEAARMFAPQIQAMNDRGRAVQKAQGGTIPEMGTVPIPTTPNPSAAYHEGGAVTKSIVPKARKQPPAWMNQIEMREGGLKREIYIDSEGYPTVGIGHRLPDEYKSKKGQVLFSDDQLNKWFTEDIAKATANASDNISNFDSLDSNVQGALINQAFQLGGTGQKGFENMIKAIEDGDMNKAATEALDSKWFNQTPKRAMDLASILRGEEPKMEYNKGGPVPRYYGLGSFVRSLFGTDDDDRFTMPDATALSGTPNYMFSNKNDIVVPPNVQTKINTDGSYFNPPYAGEPLHMGDSNFDVPEPPKFSDQDLIQNSSNALKDVPLTSLKDDDLGALKELGNDQAEDVLKQRRMEDQFGTLVNTEEGMHPDMFMRNFTDPRIGAVENYSVPANPDLYDPRRGAVENYSVPKNTYVPTNFNPERRRLEDEAYNRFGMNLNNDNTLSPIKKPVDLDPRVGVPEYYGVPSVEKIPNIQQDDAILINEKLNILRQQAMMMPVGTPGRAGIDTRINRLEKELKELGVADNNLVPKPNDSNQVNWKRQKALKEKRNAENKLVTAKTGEEIIAANNELTNAQSLLEKIPETEVAPYNPIDVLQKDSLESSKERFKTLNELDTSKFDKKLKERIENKLRIEGANIKELEESINSDNNVGKSDQRSGDSSTETRDGNQKKTQEDDSGDNVSPKNSPEDNLDNAENSNNKKLENDPTIKDKGEKAPPEVKAAAVDEIKSVFGEMFDVEELTRMAILYLGARATGASGSQAMAFAGKSYLSRLDNKYKQNKFNEHYNSLLKGNNFTRDSMELYKYTKDPNVLVTKSSLRKGSVSGDPKGEVFYTKANVRGVRGQKLRLFKNDEVDSKGDKTGNTFYTTSDGTPISQQQLEMYFTTDESTIPTTDAYIRSRNEIATGVRPVIKEKIDAFKPTDNNDGNPAMYKIVGKHKEQITMEVANFSKDLQLKEGQMVTSNIIENAFGKLQEDIDNGFYDKVRTITFTDYLDRAYIGTKVGNEKYFTYETSNGKSKTDSAKDVDMALDGLTRGVKSKGGGKWINTPPIIINDLLLKQAKIKLGNGEGSMSKAERDKFDAAYKKSIKTKPQSEMLFFLETEINELNYDDYFKRET